MKNSLLPARSIALPLLGALILTALTIPAMPAHAAGEATVQSFRGDRRFKAKIDPKNIDYRLLQDALCLATNEQRVKAGLKALPPHPALTAAAQRYARRMSEKNFFAHHDPYSKTGRTPTQRAKKIGVLNAAIAENIAGNFLRPRMTYLQLTDGLIKQWMNSPGHKRNILSNKAHHMGCGVFIDPSRRNGINVRAVQKFQWFSPVKVAPNSPYARAAVAVKETPPPRTRVANETPMPPRTVDTTPKTTPRPTNVDARPEPTTTRTPGTTADTTNAREPARPIKGGLTLAGFRKASSLTRQVNWSKIDYPTLYTAMTFVINEHRVRNGRKALKHHQSLTFAAQRHADRMTRLNFFSHEDPHDPATRTRDDRARHAGIKNPHTMQIVNLFIAIPDKQSYVQLADAIVDEWMRSPRRKQSILSTNAVEIGHGVKAKRNADGTYTIKSVSLAQWYEPIR